MAKGQSLIGLQWILYMQATYEPLHPADDMTIQLHHGYFQGEKSFGGYSIDAYACINNEHHFFEFLGCYIHPGCNYCNVNPGRDER